MLAVSYFVDTSAVRALAMAGVYTALMILGVALFAMAAPILMALAAIVLPVLAKLAFGAAVIAVFGWVTYPRTKAGKYGSR